MSSAPPSSSSAPPEPERDLSLRELLRLDDEAFVRAAFRTVLGREVDGELPALLAELHSGRRTKVELLGRLRFSADGRRRGVRLRGLLSRFVFHRAKRVPVAGSAVAALARVAHLSRFLSGAEAEVTSLRAANDELRAQLRGLTDALGGEVERLRQAHLRLDGLAREKADAQQLARLQAALEALRAAAPGALAAAPGDDAESHLLDGLYAALEDHFRGTREQIKARTAAYVPLVREAGAGTADAPVVDLACGRGEWLEVLREHGLSARGVDLNQVTFAQCKERGLEVAQGHVVPFLRALPNASVGAVTGFHLVEHLPFPVLVELLDEAKRVLRHGGVLVLETPNPDNLLVGATTFFLDPTHLHPIPGPLLQFLADARGFVRTEVRGLTEHRPTVLQTSPPPGDAATALLARPLDYALIAYKA